MKLYKICLPLLAIMLTLCSCQKYLDIKKTSTQTFIETAEDCQRLLDDYNIMNTNYPSDGLASSDDYYLGTNTYPGYFDLENQAIYSWSSAAIRQEAAPQWSGAYSAVYYANLALESLDKIKGNTDLTVWNNLRGSALFFRAYAIWNVAQVYAKPYSATAAQDPGVPARTSPDISDVFGRGTVEETYNRITQDLNEAIGLLNISSMKSTRPNKASAYAMLARVYLSMENYPQALTNADAALQLNHTLIDYNNLDQNSDAPFPQFNDEVLFHSLLTANNYASLLYPGDSGNPGARINQELYASYDNNDLRKTLFFKPNTITVKVSDPTPADPAATTDVTVNDGTYRFTGNYDPTNSYVLFNGLTVDEMYLTRAECYARSGNFNQAMGDLNALLLTRWKKVNNVTTYINMTASTADEALGKILAERRKELVMRGSRWTDLRRLNKDTKYKRDLVRQLKDVNAVSMGTYPDQVITITYPVQQTWTLPANDPRYVLLIPQKVITNANMQQNSR